MKITLLAVGKKHNANLEAAISDYTARLTHYATPSWQLVEAKLSAAMDKLAIQATESSLLLSRIPPQAVVILLDETGQQLTSPQLADKLQQYQNQSVKELVFVIGGAYGVNQALKKRADFSWSLSKLVFPHQLVRLLLVEQLYRAYTIAHNQSYHHD